MKMKKILVTALSASVALTLAGCGDDAPKKEGVTAWLTYADWGNAEVNQQLLDSFMEKYPHIDVTLDTSISGYGADFTASMIQAAQTGTQPDVFLVGDIMMMHNAGLLGDISEFWDNDPVKDKVYDNAKNLGVYDNGTTRLAVPTYISPYGFAVNLDIIEKAGLEMDEFGYDWTYEDFKFLLEEVSNVSVESEDGTSITVSSLEVFPSLSTGDKTRLSLEQYMVPQTTTLGFDAWNGSSFEYNNPEWVKYKADSLSIEKDYVNVVDGENPTKFPAGQVGFELDGIWAMTNHAQFHPDIPNIDFYPIPKGTNEVHSTVGTIDFAGISPDTTYPEEAYLLLQYMSTDPDGFKRRIEIYEELGLPIANFPCFEDEEINGLLKDIFNDMGYPGMAYHVDMIKDMTIGFEKCLPGYNEYYALASTKAIIAAGHDAAALPNLLMPGLATSIEEALKKLNLTL